MGGSCCKSEDLCPTHKNEHISSICLCPNCLQPLCDICLKDHISIHEKLGFPPQISHYSDIKKQFTDRLRNQQNQYDKYNEQNKDLLQLSSSNLIKSMTRQYFATRRPVIRKKADSEGVTTASLLQNVELATLLKNNPIAIQRLSQFLKQNLTANHSVVGNDYSHLY